jgi:hypothetical protein
MHRAVWASHAPAVPIVPPLPSDLWDQVGCVDDEALEEDIQRTLGHRLGTPRRTVGVHMAGMPSHPWIANMVASGTPSQRLYVAFEIVKDQLYVLAESPARVAALESRPPEPHPGLTWAPRMVGLELRAPAGKPLLRQAGIVS